MQDQVEYSVQRAERDHVDVCACLRCRGRAGRRLRCMHRQFEHPSAQSRQGDRTLEEVAGGSGDG